MSAAGRAPIPVHAEAVPGRPERVRWVVPARLLAFVGEPVAVPSALAGLVDDGVVARIEVAPAAVLIDLAAERTWAEGADRVRAALQQGLAAPGEWHPPLEQAEPAAAARAHLGAAARAVVAGEVGDYARSHGGSLEVVAVHDGVVDVALHGTCDGCPAAGRTLEERVLVGVRALDPSVREVRSVREGGQASSTTALDAGPAGAGGRRLLPMLFGRR
ncbi:NifU family protein [Aeromicrobium sp.]|uniref:NifU family protein n=1 Tax=Aeromicrobium sp. TaxID=1871063 RepID=UPI0035172839